ncbi:MAG: hypothetical protein OD811_02560 [Alphaproteobacteria bacterium]
MPVSDRGFVLVRGEDCASFLQGLITQDVEAMTPDEVRWGAFLTPQGKYLHDFFVFVGGGGFLLECEGSRAADLAMRLVRYRLRARVEVEVLSGEVFLIFGECSTGRGEVCRGEGWLVYGDPRRGEESFRFVRFAGDGVDGVDGEFVLPVAEEARRLEWELRRIRAGWMDGGRDLEVGRDLPAEGWMGIQGAIDWDKGCYLGQEITARVHYRGLLKRLLLPVCVDGVAASGDILVDGEGRRVGVLRSVVGAVGEHWGLALVKRNAVGMDLRVGGVSGVGVRVIPADWQLGVLGEKGATDLQR